MSDSVADVAKAESMRTLYGGGAIHDRILGVDFEITPFSFLQTNTRGAEVLYTAVRDAVRQGTAGMAKRPVLFDLYCGVGTIGQILSPLAEKVVGIELIPEAVEAAKVNATANGLTNCRFIAGDVKTEVGNSRKIRTSSSSIRPGRASSPRQWAMCSPLRRRFLCTSPARPALSPGICPFSSAPATRLKPFSASICSRRLRTSRR